MRLAFIQTGSALPRFDVQLSSVRALDPDDYAFARVDSARDWRLFHDRLELMRRGDVLCVAAEGVLAIEAAEMNRLLEQLDVRGIELREGGLTVDPGACLTPRPRIHRRAPLLLTEGQIEEIRQMHRRGVSSRQISQNLRRSPSCVVALLAEDRPFGAGRDGAVESNRNLPTAHQRQQIVT